MTKPKRGARPQIRAQANRANFDKTKAAKTVVPVTSAGVVPSTALPALPGRVWLEWHPRLDVTGSDRRAFLGRFGDTELTEILGRGDKIPRRGLSCSTASRRLYVCGPGEVHYWEEDSSARTTKDAVTPGGIVRPRGSTLTAIMDGDESD